jgi:hypothetical protein
VNRVGSFLSGRHFIAEDVSATSASSAFVPFPLAVAIHRRRHDKDQFDPVEAPQQRMGRRFPARPGALLVNFRLDRA